MRFIIHRAHTPKPHPSAFRFEDDWNINIQCLADLLALGSMSIDVEGDVPTITLPEADTPSDFLITIGDREFPLAPDDDATLGLLGGVLGLNTEEE